MRKKCDAVQKCILKNKWLPDINRVEFLAAGEYNENYIVFSGPGTYVFRINHGSQLNLENQIEYEYHVLKAVEASGVTPKPFFYNTYDDYFNTGILLMEYCEGGEFRYTLHKEKAAYVFAQVHTLEISRDLLYQKNPIIDIANESYFLLNKYENHPLTENKKRLLDYYDEIVMLGKKSSEIFNGESFCIVNTEVNSGNFIVNKDKTFLVDWEKAVISYRYQDLGHFLVPSTTLWKSDYVFSQAEKKDFLLHYKKHLSLTIDIDELMEKTSIMEKVILLRALSWCYMAYYEYSKMERPLKNKVTFNKIKSYLKDIDWFLH